MGNEILLWHGGGTGLKNLLQRHEDLYYHYKPNLPTGIFTDDIRFALLNSMDIHDRLSIISQWLIPQSLLLLIGDPSDEIKFYTPNIVVNDINSIPQAYLDHTRQYKTHKSAILSVNRGEVVFVRMPYEYCQGIIKETKL